MTAPQHSFQLAGNTVVLDDTTDSEIHDIHEYTFETEHEILENFVESLQDGDVVFDIGARTGMYTCFATQEVSDGSVVAFEPHPDHAAQLRTNLSHNSSTAKVLEYVLSDSEETVPFKIIGYEGIKEHPSAETIQKTTKSGDELVAEEVVPQPNVVKIDVEGAEGNVLTGMEEALSHPKCRTLYCEVHLPADHRPSLVDYDFTKDQILSLISEYGFQREIHVERGSEIFIKGAKE